MVLAKTQLRMNGACPALKIARISFAEVRLLLGFKLSSQLAHVSCFNLSRSARSA